MKKNLLLLSIIITLAGCKKSTTVQGETYIIDDNVNCIDIMDYSNPITFISLNQIWKSAYPFGNSKRNTRSLNWFDVAEDSNIKFNSKEIFLSSTPLLEPKSYTKTNGQTIKARYTTGVINGPIFKYGEIEADIKLPKGKNLWSAFWLYATHHTDHMNWGGNDNLGFNEIDIFECYTGNDGNYFTPILSPFNKDQNGNMKEIDGIVATLHGYKNGTRHKVNNNLQNVVNGVFQTDPSEDFHNYKLKWTPNEIVIYYDDIEVFYYDGDDIPRHSMRLIFKTGIDYNAGLKKVGDIEYNSNGTSSPMVIKNLKYRQI